MNNRATKKVIIDAGHGGTDPGSSANGIIEKDYNLKISKYISNRLNELGIENKLVRDGDETLSPTDRVNRIKNLYTPGTNVILISNHLNAGGGDGAEVIYALRNSDKLSSIIANNMLLSGQNVRKYYQRRLPSNPSKDYYFIIRDTSPDESILMEYAFLDSAKDDVSQIKNNYEGLAEAVVKSLAEYIGIKYIPPVSSNATYYIVKSGDTLYSIARKFNISVDKLKELNGLKSNLISVGQNLLVSELNASNINPNNNNNNTYYTVVKGDSLWSIAKKFNTTVDNLKKLNNLNSNLLQIGQKLIVNENASSNSETNLIKYTVVKGDTLYSISRKFNTTVSEISSINNLKTNILQIGQELLVPNNKK